MKKRAPVPRKLHKVQVVSRVHCACEVSRRKILGFFSFVSIITHYGSTILVPTLRSTHTHSFFLIMAGIQIIVPIVRDR